MFVAGDHAIAAPRADGFPGAYSQRALHHFVMVLC